MTYKNWANRLRNGTLKVHFCKMSDKSNQFSKQKGEKGEW